MHGVRVQKNNDETCTPEEASMPTTALTQKKRIREVIIRKGATGHFVTDDPERAMKQACSLNRKVE
jgi:hypothetical protein